LDQPLIGTDTGYFQVVFPGPGENLDRIRVPNPADGDTGIEAQLNERSEKRWQKCSSPVLSPAAGWLEYAGDV